MTDEIIFNKVAKIALEITQRYDAIIKIFPKENEFILKHLAASSIHMTLFMRDLNEVVFNERINIDKKSESMFLETCGCDFNKK